jgi:predicted MFS family arabinose efflux permease
MRITKPFSSAASLYKNAYTGLSRSTWLLSLVMLVNRSGTMVLPFMAIYLTSPQMGYSLFQAGIVVALFGAGAICGGFIGGKLTDKVGFHTVQLITLTAGGLLFFVVGQMKSYPAICASSFILSLVNDAFRPANSTAIAHYSREENRTRSYSLNRLAINLGWAIGASLGGFIAYINYHLLFWVDGLTNIIAALLLYILLPSDPRPAGEKKQAAPATVTRSAVKDRVYMLFICITVLYALCFSQLYSTIPVYYKSELHMSEFSIGLLMGLNGIIIVGVEMILVFHLEGKNKHTVYIFYGILLTALSFIVFNLLPEHPYTAAASLVLVTFGEILALPFMNSFWIGRTSAANRGQYAGIYTMAWSFAQVAGPASGSWTAGHFGFGLLWWIAAGICVLTAFLLRTFRIG